MWEGGGVNVKLLKTYPGQIIKCSERVTHYWWFLFGYITTFTGRGIIMFKKLAHFISLGLVLSLLGAAHAATNVQWTDGDPADHLWTSPDNWDRGEVPDGDYAAFIRGPASIEETSPIIQDGMSFTVVYIIVNEGNSDFTAYLRMTGGTVDTQNLLIAWDNSAVGNVKGVFNMSGGTVNANNLQISQGARADGGGSGTFNLTGGTFSTRNMSITSTGRIDIAGGTLILDGDQLSTVRGYIDDGLIAAWGGDGTFDLDYDVTNEGKTTVKGIHKLNPYPAHGDTISPGDVELSWTLPDPCVPGEPVPVDVYFTDDHEALSMFTDPASIQIVSKENVTSVVVPVEMGKQYFWAVDTYIGSPDDPMFGPIFTFIVDNLPPEVDAGQDVVAWLVDGVRTGNLDATVTDDGFLQSPTVQWTMVSEPNDPNSPDAVIADPTAEDTNITLSAVGEYVLQLEAFDGEYTGSDTVTINVYNDSCEAAQSLPDYVPWVGDLNGDCRVDEEDLALLEENWLKDNSLTQEWFKLD